MAVEALDSILSCYPKEGLHGRRKIYTNKSVITADNVAEIVSNAYAVHCLNRREICYLYDYYRGKQDICYRVKEIRPEINNIVTTNRANEIVTFKVSYLLDEPIQYVSRGGDEDTSEQIELLNTFMFAESKASKDKELADWLHICGVGVRMVLSSNSSDEDGTPIDIYTLDPRNAFVIYHSGLGHEPLAGVMRMQNENDEWQFGVYTKDYYWEISANGDIVKEESRTVPYVPIIEYVYNEARMGAFEIVLPLLNAINTLESDRVDGIEQFVNSILVFENCQIDETLYAQLRQDGALMVKGDSGIQPRVYRVDGELSQSGAQTLVDDIYDSILTITGMPNRNGGSSTSDTGAATIMRDGWQAAEARANDTELLWQRSEREFLRIVLNICRGVEGFDLQLRDIEAHFTRRNYANIQSKAQVLAEMLNNSKIHPKLAFQSCGIFTDSEEAYRISMEWYDSQQAKSEALVNALSQQSNEAQNIATDNNIDNNSNQESTI